MDLKFLDLKKSHLFQKSGGIFENWLNMKQWKYIGKQIEHVAESIFDEKDQNEVKLLG